MGTIREMKFEDIPILVRWGNMTPELWGSDDGKWYSQKGLELMLTHKGDDIRLVAEEDEKLVGMCLSRYMFEWYYCETLYVDRPYRGRGIATVLLAEMEKMAKKKESVTVIMFDVKADNAEAISIYKKLGFKESYKELWVEKRLR